MEIPQYHKRPVAAASSVNEVMSSFNQSLKGHGTNVTGVDLRCVLANALEGWKDGWTTMEGFSFIGIWIWMSQRKSCHRM